jgi:hypothetical protein
MKRGGERGAVERGRWKMEETDIERGRKRKRTSSSSSLPSVTHEKRGREPPLQVQTPKSGISAFSHVNT